MNILRGHRMYFDGELWRYEDNREETSKFWLSRSCGKCGKFFTKEGHDHCLGRIPNVMNACCGHGEVAEAYVQFSDVSILSGNDAIAFFESRSIP